MGVSHLLPFSLPCLIVVPHALLGCVGFSWERQIPIAQTLESAVLQEWHILTDGNGALANNWRMPLVYLRKIHGVCSTNFFSHDPEFGF